MSSCRSCGAPVRWVRTEAGKAMPLDPDPTPNGNVQLLDGGIAHVLTDAELRDTAGSPLYVTHFATCPNAKGHRR